MAAKQRRARTEQELLNASNDLYYEFWMFVKLANGLASGILGEGVLHNALLESFTLHAKVVLDFSYNDRPGEDDVVAADYLPSPERWKSARPKRSHMLVDLHADVRLRSSTEIGHLTYERQKMIFEREPWPFIEMAKEVRKAFERFLELVPEDLLGPRWLEVKRQNSQGSSAG